MFKQSVSRPLV